ncbi:hypothetical protein E2986_12130 [Frieseomelitta varia]|uniref:Uncharacterized protein n=1 Tax=Frieseomelitta varia TaxID=561572 RepID=A0A833RSK0_9HYME|nr:hypothetical protein E2986_12130 [Frieseomelitta varia]
MVLSDLHGIRLLPNDKLKQNELWILIVVALFYGHLQRLVRRVFLRNELSSLLEDVLLATTRSMIFQHDGASPHYTREVKNFLNQTYSCWIGRDGKERLTTEVSKPHVSRFVFMGAYQRTRKDYGGIREIKNRHQLTFCSDVINSSSKLMYVGNEQDILNNTCNSVVLNALLGCTTNSGPSSIVYRRIYLSFCSYNNEFLNVRIKRTNVMYGGLRPDLRNVIFTNGNVDPWHALSVLQDLNTLSPAIFINGSSHCRDLYSDSDTDVQDLTQARAKVRKIIGSWISS